MSCAKGCCATQREHYQSITIGTDRNKVMSNGYTLGFESQEQKDMDAYKRLRANGEQPKDWTGCAELEKHATTSAELRIGKILPKKAKKALEVAE